MRGEISAEELQARAEANSERSKSRLTTVLGPENYSRWAATFLGQRTVELGVSNLLRMQRQPRGSGELFARLRGHRSDLRAPTKPSHPVRLRTTGRELRSKDYEPVIQKYGLFNRKMFNKDPDPGLLNQYQLTEVNGEFVVADGASGLTWQRSGSPYPMGASPIKAWVRDVNSRGYAGHRDWRLPTGEEVMTLSEPEYYRNQLHIQPLFDDTQTCIWTADTMGEYLEALDVTMGFLHAQATDEACYLRLVRPT